LKPKTADSSAQNLRSIKDVPAVAVLVVVVHFGTSSVAAGAVVAVVIAEPLLTISLN